MVRWLAHTLRWHLSGLETWQGSAVLCCWHGHLLPGAALLLRLGRARECVIPLVREYGQSAAMEHFVHALQLRPYYLPPYEQAGARQAALRALKPMLATGSSVFLAADGHRAPARAPAADPLWLAREAGVPLLLVAFAARPARHLPTWDRKLLPLPGGTVIAQLSPSHAGHPAEMATELTTLERAAARMAASSHKKD